MLNNIKNNISKSLDEFGLSKFLRDIRKFPMLTAEEENKLALDWVKNKNFKSAHKLVNSHLRLVVKIAMGFRGYGLPLNELIAEGNVGMIQSLERFDPEKGAQIINICHVVDKSFNTRIYFAFMVYGKNRYNRCTEKTFFNLRSLKGKLKALDDGDLQPELVTEIAERLNVSEPDVVDMNRRMSGHDHSLNSSFIPR